MCTIDDRTLFTGQLLRDETLQIPISEFVAEVSDRRDVALRFSAYSALPSGPPPEPTSAWVALDGVRGERFLPSNRAIFRWLPFPSDPQLLEIRIPDGPSDFLTEIDVSLVDGLCVDANPPPDCAE